MISSLDYETAINRIYGLSPSGIRLGLDRVRAAASEIGNPEKGLFCVQVAGTNGKGTVANLVSHAASEAGLKVGLFTSPHLHRFTERFRVNGIEVREEVLFPHLKRILELLDTKKDLELTFFEVATLAAFSLFRNLEVDLAVLEVGLGGRLDATSIADPVVTAIASIGIDHTDYLGDTIEEIAFEKASIAAPGVPMVVSALQPEALSEVVEVTKRAGAPLRLLGKDFELNEEFESLLLGNHQLENAAVAIEIFRLVGEHLYDCTRSVFVKSLASVQWPGRFEILDTEPSYILDGAHNLEATRALVATLKEHSIRPDVMIFGALKGKPYEKMLELLRPSTERVVLVPPPIPRGVDPRNYALETDLIAENSKEAIRLASENLDPRSRILVTGSLFTVAAVRAILLGEQTDPPIGL